MALNIMEEHARTLNADLGNKQQITNSSISVDVTIAKPSSQGGVDGASVIVEATGPSGNWHIGVSTEGTSLCRALTALPKDWCKLTEKYADYRDEEEKDIDYFVPLEGELEIHLLATKYGIAVEAVTNTWKRDWQYGTRVWASKEEIIKFARDLAKAVDGQAVRATIGEACGGSEPSCIDVESYPLVRVSSDGIFDLCTSPSISVPANITMQDLEFVQKTIEELSSGIVSVSSDTPSCQLEQDYEGSIGHYWEYKSPSGSLKLIAKIHTLVPHELEKRIDITVGLSATGSIWSFTASANDLQKSAHLSNNSSELILYGLKPSFY